VGGGGDIGDGGLGGAKRWWEGWTVKLTPMNLGIGQTAPCPSLEQLMGITDPSDPCQAANITGQPVSQPTITGTTSNMTGILFIAGALLAVMVIARK
jgi:hypothetical protein